MYDVGGSAHNSCLIYFHAMIHTAAAAVSAQRSELGKIDPNVDDVSGTSKKPPSKVVVKKKVEPVGIMKNGSGNFVSVMLFQITLSDYTSCLTH